MIIIIKYVDTFKVSIAIATIITNNILFEKNKYIAIISITYEPIIRKALRFIPNLFIFGASMQVKILKGAKAAFDIVFKVFLENPPFINSY